LISSAAMVGMAAHIGPCQPRMTTRTVSSSSARAKACPSSTRSPTVLGVPRVRPVQHDPHDRRLIEGFYNALNACFSLHELNHAHWAWMYDSWLPMGTPGDDGISDWRTSPLVRPAVKNLADAADPVA